MSTQPTPTPPPPPTGTSPTPTTPGGAPPQTGLNGVALTTIYHHWYLDHKSPGSDEANAEDIQAVKEGRAPLPPGARVMFDVEPAPHGAQQLYWWPNWEWEFKLADGRIINGVVNNVSKAIDGYVGLQSPDRPEGPWLHSYGHRAIFIFDDMLASAGNASAQVRAVYPGTSIVSVDTMVIPWISPK